MRSLEMMNEATRMLSLGKDNKVEDAQKDDREDEKTEVKPMEEGSGEANRVLEQKESTFLSSMDKEYIQALMKLDYKSEVRKLVDDAYGKMKREPDSLLTAMEAERFKELLDKGDKDEGAELLEKAYDRAKNAQDSFLSPLDKEYIDILQELGEREEAKTILDKAREAFEERKKAQGAHLLTKLDQEYVDYLMEVGLREQARKTIDNIYMSRRTQNEILADFMA